MWINIRWTGLLKRWPDTDYRNWYLGDWASPEGIDQTAQTSVDLVNNSFIAVCFNDMQKIARRTGKNGRCKNVCLEKGAIAKKDS